MLFIFLLAELHSNMVIEFGNAWDFFPVSSSHKKTLISLLDSLLALEMDLGLAGSV